MAVLNRAELERSPLADLHAIASEVGIEGFRRLRRDELVSAIVEHAGGEEPGESESAAEAGEDAGRRERTGAPRGRGRSAEAEPPEPGEASRGRRARGGDRDEGGRRGAHRDDDGGRGARRDEGGDRDARGDENRREDDEAKERAEPEGEVRSGILDVLPNGAGFLRGDGLVSNRDDPHVSPAQIRRCELRPGDEVGGPVRPPRRSERHPSLVHVETVNGQPAEPPADRPRFEEATPGYATERLALPDELSLPPIGRGSRVAIVDPPGAEGGALLRRLLSALREADSSLDAVVALAGARPEDVPEWVRREIPVVGGAADGPPDAHSGAAALALERAKRVAERGGHALLAVDSLAALAPDDARAVFAAARRLEGAGTLTVIATVGGDEALARLATTRVVLEPGAGVRGDEPPKVAAASDTVRADLLGAG